jgi:hypothetical protein
VTGVDKATIGVVLDFEVVRDALGLPRVSVDHGDIDYDAAAEYQRLTKANRLFVNETRPIERSAPAEAVARYLQALANLVECRDLARVKELEVHGYTLNQTDALPLGRLTRCLVKMGRFEEATKELDKFSEDFPAARDIALVKSAREHLNRAVGSGLSRSSSATP